MVHFWRNQVVGTGSRVVSRSNDMSELVVVSVCPFIALYALGLPERPVTATRGPHTSLCGPRVYSTRSQVNLLEPEFYI